MMSGMASFMVAVGGTSLICYLLMNRVQNRKSGRENAGGGDVAGTSSGGDGWSLFSRSGSDGSLSDSFTSSSGDSGGGGDGGGGGGGGGGGD